MLYRPGTTLRVWNAHDVDTKIVHDEAEELQAMDEGWDRKPDQHPLDHDGDGAVGGSLPGKISTAARGRRKRETR
jgi:hypothetical protein